MMHRGLTLGVVLLAAGLFPAAGVARGDSTEDPRIASPFLQGLRDRGYYDLATEYLESVRKQADAPQVIKETAEYEFGRLLLDEAAKSGDLVRRKDLLDQARAKLDGFTKANPNHPKAPEALVELARLLVERGHLAMLLADETEVQAEKDAKTAEARTSLDQARTAYTSAETRLKTDFAKFPAFIPDDAAHREEKEEKERTHTALMQSQLQKAVVDYEQGETFKIGTPERTKLMGDALTQFEELYKKYRLNMAGLTARMWQGKCYEERGELGPAMGVYNELMQHEDPRLRPLQRYVGYFRIIVLAKRKEYALAADEAVRWLQGNNTPDALRSKEGLGVQLELAKNILAQLPSVEDESAKSAAIKKATDTLTQVVRYSSPYKPEAIELLKKYKPKAAANASDIAKMNYEDAISTGESAISSQEWDRAVPMMKQAIKRAEQLKDIDKVNYARYNLAFCYYMTKQYYDALVICDHMARRYPRGGLSPKAAEMGMASLAEAYSDARTPIDRTSDISNLIELAKFIAENYPDLEQGDTAKLTLGQIYHGTGKYDDAIAAFDSVRPKSSKSVDAQTRVGGTHWQKSLLLRDKGDTAAADAEVKKSIDSLQAALKARHDSGTPLTDIPLIANTCDLADVYLETNKPAEALKLLDPLVKEQKAPYPPIFPRLMSTELRAHIGTNQVDLAIADMGTLEKAGGTGAGLTQLYFNLGKLLKKEMDDLQKKGDSAGLARTQSAYQKFLTALVASKSGQTYESLMWAGQNMLTLGNPKEARPVFQQVLKTYGEDPKFLDQSGGATRIMLAKLRLATAFRSEGNYPEAKVLIDQLSAEYPKSIEVLMEKGLVMDAEATALNTQAAWAVAYRQWQTIALRLNAARPKPLEYYEAWYHVAFALLKEGKVKEAKQTLAGVMRLSPTLGGAEMKQKYQNLLSQLK